MVVAEAPGEEETERPDPQPLVGPTGRLAQEIFRELGYEWTLTYRTNVCKVRPPNNDLKRLPELGVKVEDFLPQLEQEINEIRPNAILASGDLALYHTTGKSGIKKWRGSILSSTLGQCIKVIPCYHFANFLPHRYGSKEGDFKYSAIHYTKLDVARAIQQSEFRDFKLPNRILQIARCAQDVRDFFQMYRDRDLCTFDIEVYRAIPDCVSFAFQSNHAISIPLIDLPTLLQVQGFRIPKVELAAMWVLVAEILANPRIRKVAQNGKFDQGSLENILRMKINNYWADPMLLSHTLYPEFPQSLAFNTSIRTEEPYYKDELKEWSEKKEKYDDRLTYNARDSAVTYEILESQLSELKELGLEEFYFNFVHKLHGLYRRLERNGFYRDQEKYVETYLRYTKQLADAMMELNDLLKEYYSFSITLTDVRYHGWVKKCLYEKLHLPQRETTGEDDLVALQANHANTTIKYRTIDLILLIRRISKTISTYLESDSDFDGMVRTSQRITGTENGRTSTSILRPPTRPYDIGLAFQTITKHGDTGSDLGKMLVPPKGHILVNIDQKQAEARVVALLSKNYELLAKYDTPGFDVHKETAHMTMGLSIEKMTKGERYVGKTCRHMAHLGAKKRRFMIELNNGAKRFHIQIPSISEWKAGEILDKFHILEPKIRGVFHAEVREALENNNFILWGPRDEMFAPVGRRRQFFSNPEEHGLFEEANAFIPQDTVVFITQRAALEIDEKYPPALLIVESHDALCYAVPEKELVEFWSIARQAFEKSVDFSTCSLPRGPLSIPAEVQIGYNYKELKEWDGLKN